MTVVTCFRDGIFGAKEDGDEMYNHWGKSQAEAIGNLVLAQATVSWDSDQITQKYVQGGRRKRGLDFAFSIERLPKPSGNPRKILWSSLHLPIFDKGPLERMALRHFGIQPHKLTLGHFCNLTIEELPIGRKTKSFRFFQKVLEHYGLSLKTS